MKERIIALLSEINSGNIKGKLKALEMLYNEAVKPKVPAQLNGGCDNCTKQAINILSKMVGMPAPNKELQVAGYKERIAICKGCEHRVFLNCGKCLCFYQIKAKFKSEKCPIGKW